MHFFVAVFAARPDEFETIMRKQCVVQAETFVKLRGLPYSVSPNEIEVFFQGKSNVNSNYLFITSPSSKRTTTTKIFL